MRVALYVDDKNYGGVLTYTVNMSSALRSAGAGVVIFTHEPDGPASEAIVSELEMCSDVCFKLPLETKVGHDARLLWRAIEESAAHIFIPNYRMMPYAAAACCSRHTRVRSVGICHNDHPSAYDLLQHYERCLSRFVCASDVTTTGLGARIPWRSSDIATIRSRPCIKITSLKERQGAYFPALSS